MAGDRVPAREHRRPLLDLGAPEHLQGHDHQRSTAIYNVQTLGLEPARLGTTIFPSDPAGPFPITIGIRTSGDRGINSTLINVPRNLGGFGGTPIEITTALCGRVPTCTSQTDARNDPTLNNADYDHNATTYPFFTNPTSCGTKDVGLTARSWRSPEPPTAPQPDGTNPPLQDSTATTPITTTGCENVPFDLGFDVDPSAPADGGTTDAGKPSAQDVVLSYPREATCPAESVEPDCWYENEDIWQAQLKDIAQSLPEGLRLSPGGGVGLEGCTYDQFGVDSSGKQVNDDPVRCPGGLSDRLADRAQPGAAEPGRRQGVLRAHRRLRPRDRRQPVEAVPADRGLGPAHQARRRRDRRRGRPGPRTCS